jgi:hypothetical protein
VSPRPRATFTAAQVDELIRQPKTIASMPAIVERDGFLRYKAPVLVEETRDIGLIIEAHLGLESQIVSPNAVLRWMNVRIRGIDTAITHRNIPGLPAVDGWHEHVWHDTYGDRQIRGIEPPPQGLSAFFRFAARLWNIRIVRDQQPSLELTNDEQ